MQKIELKFKNNIQTTYTYMRGVQDKIFKLNFVPT